MTKRQKALGIDPQEIERLNETGEYTASIEAFIVAASTLQKGNYTADQAAQAMAKKYTPWMGGMIELIRADETFRNRLIGLSTCYNENDDYKHTHDLDCLTVR